MRPRKESSCVCRRLGRSCQQRGAIRHQRLVGFLRAIPFQHREFGVMQRAALAVAEHAGEIEDAPLAGGQQLLAGEFRRGVQVEARAPSVRTDYIGREGMQVRLVAGRNLQDPGVHLGEVPGREECPQGGHDPPARRQERPPVGMDMGCPPGRGIGHGACLPGFAQTAGESGPNRYVAAEFTAPRLSRAPRPCQPRKTSVKVIASSLRKGNIVEMDDKLYVILSAENIHPGKGTPVTQVDMRRISDGVKSSQRYKTTEQVERAHVEEREYQFLYEDGDGFHFMKMETYDQVAVPEDVVGDMASYLLPEMKVKLSIYNGVAVAIELPQRATFEVTETEPAMKGQTASSSYKPAILSNGARVMVPPHIAPGTRIVVMTADGTYVERAKD